MKNGTICLPMAPFVVLVGVAGFEPKTSSSRTKHATELRYISFDISIAHLKYLLIIADQFPPFNLFTSSAKSATTFVKSKIALVLTASS